MGLARRENGVRGSADVNVSCGIPRPLAPVSPFATAGMDYLPHRTSERFDPLSGLFCDG